MSKNQPDQVSLWEYEVDYVPAGMHPLRLGTAAILRDFKAFSSLREKISPDDGLNGPSHNDPNCSHGFKVKGPPNDPQVQHVITKLDKLGWSPVFQGLTSPDQWDKYYPIKRTVPETSKEESNWLLLWDAGGDGGRILRMGGNDLVVIAKPEEAKKPGDCLNIMWCELAVSQRFKDCFEKAGLSGAVFRPITYVSSAPGFHPKRWPNKPLPLCKRIYWMDSSVTAPWARTPRRLALHNPDSEEDHPLSGALLGHTNEPLLGQVGDVVFDNEGYCGRGIEYGRADMDAMEGVDYIRMAEWGRECKGVWRSYHIVSQRFRKWAHDFGCRFRMSGIPLVE